MTTNTMEQTEERPMSAKTKAYKGLGMEGFVAKWYAKSTANSMNDFRAEAHRVAALLAPGTKVLEVAPGPGYFAIELAKLGNYAITGLDISKTFVEIAQKNAEQAGVRAEFRHGSVSNMPLESDQFDFLFCRAAFKNFSEPVRALQEMQRVLKAGGRALIVDLRRDASLEAINEAVSRMGLGIFSRVFTRLAFRFMLLKRAYTKREFEQLLTQTQFRSIGIEETLIGMDIWLEK
jgi:ubiquinone/menaquinone biosynthesis C-methylase UbiE